MSFFKVFKNTIPVMLGYIPLGAAYALLAVTNKIDPILILLMSVIVYAGSGQFLLVALLGAGSGLWEIFLATFLLNSRHIFYTLSLLEEIKNLRSKFYVMFALTDESFALLKSMKIAPNQRDFVYFYTTFLNQIYWIIGTIFGIVIGTNFSYDFNGIEFSLTALFAVLSIELFKQNKNFNLLFISILFGVLGVVFLPREYMLVITLFVAVFTLICLRKFYEHRR